MSIKMLSGGAANGFVNRLRAAFKASSGLDILGDFGAVGGMRDRVLGGEAVDIIILTRAIMDQLAKSGHVDPDSIADLGHVETGIGVREGAALPDVSTADGLRATLLKADAIYTPDTINATAGIHVASMLERLGIAKQTAGTLREYPNGQMAMAAMVAGSDESPVGCTQVTEILNTPGVAYISALPAPYGLSTVYTAGVSTSSCQPKASKALISMLTSLETQAKRMASGFS